MLDFRSKDTYFKSFFLAVEDLFHHRQITVKLSPSRKTTLLMNGHSTKVYKKVRLVGSTCQQKAHSGYFFIMVAIHSVIK